MLAVRFGGIVSHFACLLTWRPWSAGRRALADRVVPNPMSRVVHHRSYCVGAILTNVCLPFRVSAAEFCLPQSRTQPRSTCQQSSGQVLAQRDSESKSEQSEAQVAQVVEPARERGESISDEEKREVEADSWRTRGKDLFMMEDYSGALQCFEKAHDLFPTWASAVNSAKCLDKLGYVDEAIERLEFATVHFSGFQEKKELAEKAKRELQSQVGSVEVLINVQDAVLVVDSRSRGKLPRAESIPLLPGTRQIRIFKEGYATYERELEVKKGKRERLEVRLLPLVGAGRLKIGTEQNAKLDAVLTIDGVRLGTLPWEGTLSGGRHLYWIEAGDLGTGPVQVVVSGGGHTTSVSPPELVPIGPPVRFHVEPPQAELRLDSVIVERTWQGRLPVGSHRLSASAEGYVTGVRTFMVTGEKGGEQRLLLEVNRAHPRWPTPEKPRIWGEVLVGPLFSSSPASDGASSCGRQISLPDGQTVPTCSSRSLPFGAAGGFRGGYRLVGEFGVDLTLGYFYIEQRLSRAIRASGEEGTNGWWSTDFRDTTRVRGQYATLAASYGLDPSFPLTFRLALGIAVLPQVLTTNRGSFYGTMTDPEGSGVTAKIGAKLQIPEEAQRLAAIPLLAPEVRISFPLRAHLSLEAGLAFWLLFAEESPRTGKTPGLAPAEGRRFAILSDVPKAFGNASAQPGILELPRERSLGMMWAIFPSVGIRYGL